MMSIEVTDRECDKGYQIIISNIAEVNIPYLLSQIMEALHRV